MQSTQHIRATQRQCCVGLLRSPASSLRNLCVSLRLCVSAVKGFCHPVSFGGQLPNRAGFIGGGKSLLSPIFNSILEKAGKGERYQWNFER
jgi:hypothetical protein